MGPRPGTPLGRAVRPRLRPTPRSKSLLFEHFLVEKKGFGYAIEGIGLHGLPFRLDGHAVNAGRSSFGLLGVQPTIEYNFTDRIVGEVGVLFTALGVDDIAAIYPNFSLYYYWNPTGPVVGR
jgi:hypothetical protein